MKRTEFPLSWPTNWPRTTSPSSSRFKTSLAGALKNVGGELERFARDSGKRVTEILVSSNVTLTKSTPKDTGVAVFFTWDGIATCIAVDRYTKVEDNLQAIALVLDAERTKMRHGGLNLVRASFVGYMALPSGSATRPWHEVLQVQERATSQAIRESYLVLRSKHHPDKGGDAKRFHEVQAAYDLAKEKGLVTA